MNKRKIMIMIAGMVLPILAPQASAAAEHHDWEDQHVLSINREPARAAFMPYQAKKGDSQMLLNGEWKFRAVGQGYNGGLSAMCRQYGISI